MIRAEGDKPYDELTDDELVELAARDWSEPEILNAVGLALASGDMPAVVSLLHRLSAKAPRSAQRILDAIQDGGAR